MSTASSSAPSASSTDARPHRRSPPQGPPTFPSEPIVIQTLFVRRGVMNHSYRDFSQVLAANDYVAPNKPADMSFAQTIHFLLSHEDDFSHCITWLPHGRAFKIIIPQVFEQMVCPRFFGHGRYSSFLRQLNNHGFKHLTKGADRNCYYHEFFLRNRFHLCQYMPRPKDYRRLIADPDNEPDFYEMSLRHPLETTPEMKSLAAPLVAPLVARLSAPKVPPPQASFSLSTHSLTTQLSQLVPPHSPIRSDPTLAFGGASLLALRSQLAMSHLLVQQHPQQQPQQHPLPTPSFILPPVLPVEEEGLPLVLRMALLDKLLNRPDVALLRYQR